MTGMRGQLTKVPRPGLVSMVFAASLLVGCSPLDSSTSPEPGTAPSGSSTSPEPGTAPSGSSTSPEPGTAPSGSPSPVREVTPGPGTIRLVTLARGGPPDYPLSLAALGEGSGSPLWSVQLGRDGYPLVVASDRVLLADSGAVRQFDLATGAEGAPLFQSKQAILSMAVAPGHRRLAVTLHPAERCYGTCAGAAGGQLVVIDLPSASVGFAMDADDPRLAGGLGSPGTVTWLSDEVFVLALSRFSPSLGSSYLVSPATGAVRQVDPPPDVVHPGTSTVALAVKSQGPVGCYDWPAVELRDIYTWTLLSRVDGGSTGLLPLEFSPTGDEVLIRQRDWAGQRPFHCGGPFPPEHFLLLDTRGMVSPAPADPDIVRAKWYGAEYLGWSCPGGLNEFRRGNTQFGCGPGAVGTLSKGGVELITASDLEVYTIPR